MDFSVLMCVDVMKKTEISEDTGRYLPTENADEHDDEHNHCQ